MVSILFLFWYPFGISVLSSFCKQKMLISYIKNLSNSIKVCSKTSSGWPPFFLIRSPHVPQMLFWGISLLGILALSDFVLLGFVFVWERWICCFSGAYVSDYLMCLNWRFCVVFLLILCSRVFPVFSKILAGCTSLWWDVYEFESTTQARACLLLV